MAIVEVSIIPIGTEGTGLSGYIAHAIKVLSQRAEREGLKFQIGAMGTVIEGDVDIAIAAIREMQEALFRLGCKRLITRIEIDDRRDKLQTAEDKVRAVEEKLK